jgi:VWFA-related protein
VSNNSKRRCAFARNHQVVTPDSQLVILFEHQLHVRRARYFPFLRIAPFALLLLAASSICRAQQNPPVIHSQSTVVLVPTLVKTKSGEIIHGLTANDFIVEDNGVEQKVQLDDSPDAEPISVVVAVQTGRTAELQLDQPESLSAGTGASSSRHSHKAPLTGLGTMLESYVGESQASVAVVTFDSQIQLLQNFSEDIPGTANALRSIEPGDGGAVILDALLYSLDLLEHRPPEDRRVIILISESRDHGSHVAKLEDVVQRVGVTNTLVYSLSFSPARAEFMRDVTGKNPNSGQTDLLAPIVMAVNALRKNIPGAVAQLTGGDYETFGNKRSFDVQMDALAGRDRNRYFLSFQPTDTKPGPHTITVRLRNPGPKHIVTARTMYWAGERQGAAGNR